MDLISCVCDCGTQKQLVIYLHITLVCVDPVKQSLWSHPFYWETTLRTHTGERSNKISTETIPKSPDVWPDQHVWIHSVLAYPITLGKDDTVCESSLGNKALEEQLFRRWISQRNIYIVTAIELINRVTDKGESLSLRAIKTLTEKLSTADKATLVNICGSLMATPVKY